MADLESKLSSRGEINVKIIRVCEGGPKNRFIGNVMVSIRHLKEDANEFFSVKVQQISSTAARNQSLTNKLSINKFEVTINHTDRKINFGPEQGMQLEEQLQNKGIGTFAFNTLISILKNVCPNYSIVPYEFTLTETSDSNKDLIMNFYSKFNIQASFLDDERTEVIVKAGSPIQLSNFYNEDKVTELNVEEYILNMITEKARNEVDINNFKAEIERMSEETIGGIPKKQLIKYTLICCGASLLIVFLLLV